jgi:hypothetical protein
LLVDTVVSHAETCDDGSVGAGVRTQRPVEWAGVRIHSHDHGPAILGFDTTGQRGFCRWGRADLQFRLRLELRPSFLILRFGHQHGFTPGGPSLIPILICV